MKSTIPSTPAGLEITPFTVTTEWVTITIGLSVADADFLAAQSDIILNGIGGEVFIFGSSHRREIEAGFEDAEGFQHIITKAGGNPKGEPRPFSFSLPLWQWRAVERTASFFSTSPEQFARAAIVRRIAGIREFNSTQTKKGGAA